MSVEDFASYIRSIATIISLDPNTMLRVARLRDLKWVKSIDRNPNEKPRTISLGDAIHIVSALFVKEALKVNDLEFLTFDDGRSKNTETDSGSKSLSLLNAHLYTNGISYHPDVQAVCSLKRIKPIIKQASFV